MNVADLNSEQDVVPSCNIKPAKAYTSSSLHDPVKLRIGVSGWPAVPPRSVPQLFKEVCEKYPNSNALDYETPDSGVNGWTTISYVEYQRKVRQAALMLLHVGLEARSSVGIIAFNCPEWFYAELGTMCAGGVVAAIYSSNSAEAVFHVLDTSDATVCVVDDTQQMAKVRAIKARLPRLKAVIQLHGPYQYYVEHEPGYYRWCDLKQLQLEEQLGAELDSREREVAANDCCLLIYTSGTVGMPKAVMISHDNVTYNVKVIGAELHVQLGKETVVSYLPLNHIAAQIFDLFLVLECAGCVCFGDRNALKGTLARTLARARPTRMFGVPRVFEKIQEQLVAGESKAKPYTRLLLTKVRETVELYNLTRIEGKQPSYFLAAKYWLASKVTRSIQQALGLQSTKTLCIGGAPVTEELKRFFLGLDLPLSECYGLSESGGAITIDIPITNLCSSGQVIKGNELKINEPNDKGQGEICIRSRSNLMGYLHEPLKTSKALSEDNWLLSGDLGYLDKHNNLVICGRLKEIIITAGGENIPPAHIEELIKRELPSISNALLVGDHRKYLTVLLTLKTETDSKTGLPLDDLRPETIEWLQSLDLAYTRLSDVLNIPADLQLPRDCSAVEISAEPKLCRAIEEGIQRANKHSISNAQKVQKFALLPHDFSIPTNELGPTLKIRRNTVFAKYANVIESLYK